MNELRSQVDVLSPALELMASFVCVVEAGRYACLIYEPGLHPLLRRSSDGAVLRFTPERSSAALVEWAAGRPLEREAARA